MMPFIMDSLTLMESKMGKGRFFIAMAKFIRASLSIMFKKGKECNIIRMAPFMLVSSKMEKDPAKVGFNGLMEKSMMANGKTTSNMEVGYGKASNRWLRILGNGIMVQFVGSAC